MTTYAKTLLNILSFIISENDFSSVSFIDGLSLTFSDIIAYPDYFYYG
ncbi:hypothetical protein AB71_1071 [Escherichia coli 1-182-04_S1_C3]|nr:hypothetical protein ECDEC8C_6459 [Escherichia coli DEC8C]EZJ98369.1 hypothetical protein AB71_1071 [Escherichia coli 1-182-04_S1_C3]